MSKRSGLGKSMYQRTFYEPTPKEFTDPKIIRGFDLAKRLSKWSAKIVFIMENVNFKTKFLQVK